MAQAVSIPTWKTEMNQLAPGVYAYIQAGGGWCISNAGLIAGKDYAIAVDSLTNISLTETLIKEIKNVTNKPVRHLIYTHPHGDHNLGAHLFTGATIISQNRCREVMVEEGPPDPDILKRIAPTIDFTGGKYTLPDITYDSRLTLYQDDREVQLIHDGPGHTVGDTIVFLPKEGVVFAGDLLFYPCTPLCVVGSFAGWIKYLDMMLSLDAKTYVPGHGAVCGKEGVIAVREYMCMVYNEGRKRFDSGMNTADAAKDIDLGQFKQWGESERIRANLERLYREFKGEVPLSPIDMRALFASDQS